MKVVKYDGVVVAESDEVEEVEGNIYFPPGAVNREYLEESDKRTTCPWKGEAHYYDIVVDGERHEDQAWCYPEPKDEASHIKEYVAFFTDVDG